MPSTQPSNHHSRPDVGAWGLATFHAVTTVVALLVAIYTQGNLGQLLGGLNTFLGFYLFGALWLTSWLCTARAVRNVLRAAGVAAPPGAVLVRTIGEGVLWGGVNGVLFLLSLFALSLVSLVQSWPVVTTNLPEVAAALRASLAGFGLFLVIGVVFAYFLGAAIGLIFALIDLALLRLARSLD